MKTLRALILPLFLFTASCQSPSTPMTDNDGNSSGTLAAAGMVWSAENLRATHFRNGDPIPEVTDPEEWASLTSPACCSNANSAENQTRYGRLYNWYAVNDPRGLAPVGWHVATDSEWTRLTESLGGDESAGGALKATELRTEPNEGATDAIGFRLLPAGGRRDTDGDFLATGGYSRMWTATELSPKAAEGRSFVYFDGRVRKGKVSKKTGLAVRCVKD